MASCSPVLDVLDFYSGRICSDVSISLMSWNLLAPCYKSVRVGDDGTTVRESELPELWTSRHEQLTDLIQTVKPNILCVQEFWFDDECLKLYYERLSQDFEIVTLKRRGAKEDGLATMLCKPLIEIEEFKMSPCPDDEYHCETRSVGVELRVEEMKELHFSGAGERVVLLSHLKVNKFHDLLIANVHLTFHHGMQVEAMRTSQARELVEFIDLYLEENACPRIPVILVGDFNGCEDTVGDILHANGYTSAHEEFNNIVTHMPHTKKPMCADFVFIRQHVFSEEHHHLSAGIAKLQAESLTLLPQDLDESKWPHEFSYSDHRPLLFKFKLVL